MCSICNLGNGHHLASKTLQPLSWAAGSATCSHTFPCTHHAPKQHHLREKFDIVDPIDAFYNAITNKLDNLADKPLDITNNSDILPTGDKKSKVFRRSPLPNHRFCRIHVRNVVSTLFCYFESDSAGLGSIEAQKLQSGACKLDARRFASSWRAHREAKGAVALGSCGRRAVATIALEEASRRVLRAVRKRLGRAVRFFRCSPLAHKTVTQAILGAEQPSELLAEQL